MAAATTVAGSIQVSNSAKYDVDSSNACARAAPAGPGSPGRASRGRVCSCGCNALHDEKNYIKKGHFFTLVFQVIQHKHQKTNKLTSSMLQGEAQYAYYTKYLLSSTSTAQH